MGCPRPLGSRDSILEDEPEELENDLDVRSSAYELIQEAQRLVLDVQRYERQIEEYDQAIRRAATQLRYFYTSTDEAYYAGIPREY